MKNLLLILAALVAFPLLGKADQSVRFEFTPSGAFQKKTVLTVVVPGNGQPVIANDGCERAFLLASHKVGAAGAESVDYYTEARFIGIKVSAWRRGDTIFVQFYNTVLGQVIPAEDGYSELPKTTVYGISGILTSAKPVVAFNRVAGFKRIVVSTLLLRK